MPRLSFQNMDAEPVVANAIAAGITAIKYTNFKDSVPDLNRCDAYLAVWKQMYWWQQSAFPPPPPPPQAAPQKPLPKRVS